jgi:hypothetical protein
MNQNKNLAMNPPNQLPPEIKIKQMALGYWLSQCLYVAAKLGIADLLTDSPKHCNELAAATNANSDSLYRILRALASVGVFAETESRCFQLTPMAECLRGDVPNSVKDMTLMLVDEVHYDTWGSLLHSVQTGESSFEHLHGMSFFEYIQENPATGEVFDRAMTENSRKNAKAITGSYSFAEVKTVVDIGGDAGILISDILRSNPHLKGVLLELPQIIKKAPPVLKNAGANDRCQLIEGDFFTTIPTGGDLYLLKHVLHNWDDEKAIAILRNCRRAMEQKGKLLVIERIILPGNEPAFDKLLDLEMLVMTSGGRERTEVEFRELFKTAGFQLTKITPTPEDISILEGVIL